MLPRCLAPLTAMLTSSVVAQLRLTSDAHTHAGISRKAAADHACICHCHNPSPQRAPTAVQQSETVGALAMAEPLALLRKQSIHPTSNPKIPIPNSDPEFRSQNPIAKSDPNIRGKIREGSAPSERAPLRFRGRRHHAARHRSGGRHELLNACSTRTPTSVGSTPSKPAGFAPQATRGRTAVGWLRCRVRGAWGAA